MIFVCVGSQLPFDRLTQAVEMWAETCGRSDDIFYQIGDGTPPARGAWVRQLAPDEFEKRCRDAEFVVSHAGMGILSVVSSIRRKIIVFPRRLSEPGEIRNDHQMHTAHRWVEKRTATVAISIEELYEYLNNPEQIIIPCMESPEENELIDAVRSFIHTGILPPPKKRMFDGIVCFGGTNYIDSNREHCCIRLVEELSRYVPTLYINPTWAYTSAKEFRKRKTCNFWRKNDKFSVLNILPLPKVLEQRIHAWQVRRAVRKTGIRNPLLWIACPQAMKYINRMKFDSFVYFLSDRIELLPCDIIYQNDRLAKAQADVTLFCNSLLFERESSECRNALCIDSETVCETWRNKAHRVLEMLAECDIRPYVP